MDLLIPQRVASTMSKVREYNLNDPAQELDDLAYWRERSVEERLDALQAIRRSWGKMTG